MIPNQAKDSSQRGFLQPGPGQPFSFDSNDPTLGFDQGFWDGPTPLYDEALEDFFQQLVAGVAGIDGTLARPRYQSEPPDLPDFGTDWVAVGVISSDPIGPWAAVEHDPRGDGRDWMQRHETIDVLASFYGPNCGLNSGRFQSGIRIAQNREALYLNHMGFIEVTRPIRAPALIKNRWTDKYDLHLIVSRVVIEVYPVLTVTSASGIATTDVGYIGEWTDT